MKKTLKKALSLLLAIVMLVSTMSVGLGSIMAFAASVTIDHNHKAVIAVPETVYMTPSTGASTVGKYYVNNTVTAGSYALNLEANNANENGYVQFYIPGAVDFQFAVNTITSGVGDIKVAERGTTDGGTYENTPFGSLVDANGYFAYNTIGMYIDGAGLSAGQTALAEWKFTVTMNDGSTRIYYAYSTLYAPFVSPVGAAAEAQAGSKKVYLGSIFWVDGVHSVSASGYSGATAYYPNTDNFVPLTGVLNTFNNEDPTSKWLQTGSNGLSNSINYLRGNEKNHRRVNVISPVANLTVDTSRYNNFNQIPNFKLGYLTTDSEGSSSGSWYIADYTGKDYENGDGDGKDVSNSTNGGSEKGRRQDYYNAPYVSLITSGSDKNCELQYYGTWNYTIPTGKMMLKAAGYSTGTKSLITYTCWNNNFIELNVTGADKAALRKAVLEGSTLNANNYTSASWSNYQAILQTTAQNLGTPSNTNVDVSALESARNALKTTVTLNANGGSIGTTSFEVTVGNKATVDYGVSSYKPTRTGYTFKGWATSASATSGSTSTVNAGLMPTLYATWEANKYNVVFDNLVDFSKWNTTTAGNGVISNVTDNGFTLTSNDGVSESTSSSPFFPVTPGKQYRIDIDFTGTAWDVYIFFCDANGSWVDFADGPSNRFSYGGTTGIPVDNAVFTAPDKAEVVKAQIRVDANGSNNTVRFENIRVYEVGTVEDGVSYENSKPVTYNSTYGTLPTPTRDGYEFLGWYKADGTMLNASDTVNITDTLYVTSKWKQLGYTITWKVDGQQDVTTVVEAGKTPVYPNGTPTKAATAQYTYTFTGWSPSLVAATADTTYTAQFSQTTNKYKVTWIVDGETAKEEYVEYGQTPAFGSTPTKAADAQYTYTFTGWDTTPAAVTKDVTYTAQFSTTTQTYTVEWVVNDQVVETDTVEYGKVPTYDGAEPTKAPNAQYSYTFDKWSPAIAAVTGHARYEATFTATLNKYTVNWVVDNEVYHTEQVEYGTKPTLPENPTKEADAQYTYTFKEWSPSVTAVMNDTNYTAVFDKTVNKYTVTWVDEDGTTELYSAEFEYGATPVYGAENPTKAATAQYTYTFAGWDRAYETVTGEATYTAKYSATVNKYTIKFVNHDGTELQSSEVEYGTKPEYKGAEPTKAKDAQYTYVFTGWDPEIAEVTEDATYTAQFSETINVYTVTWVNYDGTELEVDENVPYGTTPTYDGATPTKPQTDKYEYTFADKWSPEVNEVTGDVTYTAQFNETVRKYTITWVVNGTPVYNEEVEYDTVPVYNEAVYGVPTKAADAQYTYTFKDWSPAVVAVTGPATYVAEFNETVNTYTVTWVNDDDSVLETDENVPYGATPSYDGATPTKAKDAQFTYTFDKWTPEISTVEGNVTYKATYKTTINTYTVTWKNENGNILETDVNVPYGTTPSYDGATPTKARTDEFTYTHKGWTPEVSTVTGDATYTATYTAEKNKYTITWKNDDGSVIDTTTVEYGVVPTHADPAKEATAQYTYTFAGWDPEIVAVTGDATYTAIFTETVNKYTVTWIDEDGTTVLEKDENVPYGATPTFDQANPTKAATAQYTYAFAGWAPTVSTVTGDATYTATYSSTVNSYEVKWVVDGNTVRTDIVEYGKTPDFGSTPTKVADAQYTYTFARWDNEVVAVTGPATYTAVFDKTVNEYTITWIVDGVETTTQVAYGEMPEMADPTKAQTPEFTYKFAGWTPAVVSVTEAATYTATFTPITRSYKVTWVGENGEELYTEDVLVGATIPTKEVPYKDGFIGVWGSYPATMPTNDLTIKAEYYENGIKVNWVIDDTTTHQTAVRQGEQIAPNKDWETKAPSVSTVYTFVGWSETKGGDVVETFPTVTADDTEDKTYYAVFTESAREYTITWIIDGKSETTTVAYGSTPSHADPTKEATAQYTYTFSSWSPAIAPVTGDATYTAQFDSTVNKYTVTWIVDGQPVKTEDVEYGTTPTFGADPTKAATAQYTYTFAGWAPAVSSVTGVATYTATFNATVNKYTVTWIDENGTVLETDTGVEYGTKPSFDKAEPTKTATAQYTYTFAGWEGLTNETTVTGDVTFKATYSSTVNKYTVTWVNDDGTVLETDTDVPYGTVPTYDGATPVKAATAQYTYTFDNWTTAIVAVTGNVTYTAKYASTVNEYTITFVDEDGNELQSGKVAYGETPAYTGEDPVKEGNAQYSYKFTGWTPAIADVTEDATYKATFAQVVNEYTVTWVVEGVTVETDENVPYGTIPTFNGTTPTKAASAQYTYTFAGWDPTVSAITGDTTYTATFTPVTRSYTVTWVDDDETVISTDTVEYGKTPTAPADPEKETTAQYTYEFAGWTPEVVAVTGDVTYKATYTATVNKYTVTWVVEGETVETDENVEYGTMASYDGAEPTKTGNAQYSYTFDKWTPEVSEVTGDVTYTATFTQSVNKYTITWIVNGVETTEQVEYGTVPTFTGSTDKAPDNTTVYTFAGWDKEVVAVTGEATYTATYSEAVRLYTITWIVDGKTTTEKYEYNEVPTFKGSTDKAPTEGASYVFKGWDKEIVNVTADATYTAEYDVTVRMFTITWLVDGQEIKQQWAYGTVPTFDGSTDKAPSATATYTFAGWDKTPVEVKSDATYTATYTESVRKYTVVWYVDGEFYATQDVAYNTVIPTPGLPAEKEGYTVRWDNTVTVMPAGDVEIHAIYTPKMYPVYWIVDGLTVYSASVPFGGTIPTMIVPAKEGHTGKWVNVPETMPAGIVTIETVYTANTYSVFWKIGNVQDTDTATYGNDLVLTFDVETLPEALRITINNALISEDSYNYDSIAGTLIIYGSAIIGNISIVAKSTSGSVNVSNTIFGGSSSNTNSVIEMRTTYHTTITPAAGNLLPKTVDVFVDGILLTSGYTYDSTTGRLTINAEVVIGELEIYAECIEDPNGSDEDDNAGSGNCSCNCHSTNAFIKFFFSIGNFFRRIFGMTQYRYCGCGVAHW